MVNDAILAHSETKIAIVLSTLRVNIKIMRKLLPNKLITATCSSFILIMYIIRDMKQYRSVGSLIIN